MKRCPKGGVARVLLLCLAACGGGGGNTPPPPPPTSATGRLVDTAGNPVANVGVRIGAQSTTTDASGRFSFSNVTTPYDLHILGERNSVDSYIGLTLRALPDIVGGWPEPVPVQVSGTVSGGSLPASGRHVLVAFCTQQHCATTSAAADGSYGLAVDVTGSSASGTLLALESTRDQAAGPTAWGRYAVAQNVALVPASFTTLNVTLTSALGTRAVGGTLAGDPTFDPVYLSFWLSDGTGPAFLFGEKVTPTAQGAPIPAALLPTIPGFTVGYWADGSWPPFAPVFSEEAAPVPAGDLAVALDPLFALIAPAAQATGVTATTDFTWAALANPAVYRLRVGCSDHGAMFRQVYTTQPTARLFAFGTHPLISGASCDWYVESISPLASVDARLQPLPAVRRYSGTSELRQFDVE